MKPFSTPSCAGRALPVMSADLCGPGRRLGRGCRLDPQGLSFIDAEAVEALTGYPIRSAWSSPSAPQPLPAPDAIEIVPATFNTINKGAAGTSDTLVLGILCEESYGLGTPDGHLALSELRPGRPPCVRREPAETAHDGHPDQLL